MKILIIDNYDSFTYNLYQYVGEIMQFSVLNSQFSKIDVVRNDGITVKEIRERGYDRIILSPGPGNPTERKYFGICGDVLLEIGKKTPVLGVCLGMQGIAYYFGGKVVKAKRPMHGMKSYIFHDGKGVFKDLPQDLEVMRYHSLIADPESLPDCLEVTAIVSGDLGRAALDIGGLLEIEKSTTFTNSEAKHLPENTEIMGLRHKTLPIHGVQFHPESIGTKYGKKILKNFLDLV